VYPEVYVKALVTGIFFHRGPTGEPGRGLIYQGLREMDENGVTLHSDPAGEPREGGPSTDFQNYLEGTFARRPSRL
jgi:hypothetical protein